MKLTYRGVVYNYNPPTVAPQEPQAIEKTGKYRGIDVRFRNRKKPLVLQPTLDLKYRGVAYHPDRVAQPAAPALSVADKARSLMMAATVESDRRQQSMLTRLAAEVGVGTAY